MIGYKKSARFKSSMIGIHMMMEDKESFLKNWEGYTQALIAAPAKKKELIEKKRRQIAEGALKVFFAKGYHPATIREIAKACDMSMGQLYHYISSKDDVLFLVHRHMQTSWYNYLAKFDIESIKDPFSRLKSALRSTLEFHIQNKKLIQFIYSESKYLNKKHLRVVLEMDDKNVVEYWRSLLREVNDIKTLRIDINFAANLLTYMNVFLALRGWNLKDRPIDKHVDSLIAFIFDGLKIPIS